MRQQHGSGVDRHDVRDAHSARREEARDEQRAAADRTHHERLQQAAFRVAAHGVERHEDGDDGAEEERHEHRETEKRRPGQDLLVDVDRRAGAAEPPHLVKRLRAAVGIQGEERERQHDHDEEHLAANGLAQRVAGDDPQIERDLRDGACPARWRVDAVVQERAHPSCAPTRPR